jgi:dsRNA-specific ribonuclease
VLPLQQDSLHRFFGAVVKQDCSLHLKCKLRLLCSPCHVCDIRVAFVCRPRRQRASACRRTPSCGRSSRPALQSARHLRRPRRKSSCRCRRSTRKMSASARHAVQLTYSFPVFALSVREATDLQHDDALRTVALDAHLQACSVNKTKSHSSQPTSMQVFVGCVGFRRIAEACTLVDTPLAPPPLHASPLAPHVGRFVLSDAVHSVSRFVQSAMRIAASGPARGRSLGTVRAAKQVREEAGIVALHEVLGYRFQDAHLERTARVHSCALALVLSACLFRCDMCENISTMVLASGQERPSPATLCKCVWSSCGWRRQRSCGCRSWMHHDEEDCGKLEFLGDAVLGLVVTSYIFYCLGADTRKGLKPGQLSDLRSSIVKNDCLAFMACVRGFDRCLLHSSPTLYENTQAFRAVRSLALWLEAQGGAPGAELECQCKTRRRECCSICHGRSC